MQATIQGTTRQPVPRPYDFESEWNRPRLVKLDGDRSNELHRLYPEAQFVQLTPAQQLGLLQPIITNMERLPDLAAATLWLTDASLAGLWGRHGALDEPLVKAGVNYSFYAHRLRTKLQGQVKDCYLIGFDAECEDSGAAQVEVTSRSQLARELPGIIETFRAGIGPLRTRRLPVDDTYAGTNR